MITGKELHGIYVACSREDGVHMPTWEGSHPNGHRLYDRVAKKLNEGHITPLQGEIEQSKDLFHTFMAGANDLFLERKQQVADLKALVQDFVNLLEDENLLIEDCLDEWGVKRDETLTTAKALLNEENDTCKQ